MRTNGTVRRIAQVLAHPQRSADTLVQRWFQGRVDPYLPNRHLDLVDFGELHLFMFRNDNLYERFVPAARKHRSVRAIQEQYLRAGYPPSSVDARSVRTTDDPREIFSIVVDLLARRHGPVTILDVGAHVGAFGLRIASFLRTTGLGGRVVCFEPGTAAELLPYNVLLNGLSELVHIEHLAVSDLTGLDILHVAPGNTDSDSLTGEMGRGYDEIVQTVRIDDYVRDAAPEGSLLIKLDTEGLEPRLIASMADLRVDRMVIIAFEFMPWRYPNARFGLDLLESLAGEGILYDLYYAPRVPRVDPIEQADFTTFIQRVRERPYGYTDVLVVPRTLIADRLGERLATLRHNQPSFVF